MSALRLVLVSSALLLLVGTVGPHPASASDGATYPTPDPTTSPLVVSELHPCAVNGDEYLVLSNRGAEAVNLTGWTIADGEGALLLLGGTLLPGSSLSISENAPSFAYAYGSSPGLHVPGWDPCPGAEVSGDFRMADSGDVVELLSPEGLVSDVVAYGSAIPPSYGWSGAPVPALRSGEVARRVGPGHVQDTDAAQDWMPFREHRYGFTEHGVWTGTVPGGAVTAFVSPDCSLDTVLAWTGGAAESIRLCSYELSSVPVCMGLVAASSRGVDVRVLVDAMPVGGMSAKEEACLSAMAALGVDVRVLGGSLEDRVVRHVGALHSKYIVVDKGTLVALSENFVEEGVPSDEVFGNRGWGVSVTEPSMGAFMASVFDDDSRSDRPDVWPWREDPRFDPGARMPEDEVGPHPQGMLAPLRTSGQVEVSVLLSPDASLEEPFLVPMVSCSTDMLFEQFLAEAEWTTRWSDVPAPNPLVLAVGETILGGGTAKGLFDSSWYNRDENLEAVSYMSCVALGSGLPPSFGLLPEGSPIATLHNKGLVLDGSAVVSSNNWVYASFARNRELAVVVRSGEVSSYLRMAFELDWVPDTTAPVADAGEDAVMESPGEFTLDASSSRDDRAIASVEWDIDGDGSPDASGLMVSHLFEASGTYEVWVEVTDAWGNAAVDSVRVVVGPGTGGGGSISVAPVALPWPLPALASVVAVVAASCARKLNLLRQSSRREG